MNEQRPGSPTGAGPVPAKPASASIKPHASPDGERLGLVEASTSSAPSKKITQFGSEHAAAVAEHHYKRQPVVNGFGSCRMRSFMGKISGPGLEYMDNNINQWLDAHPDVEVKFVTSSIGPVEGKTTERAIVLNLWY